MSGWITMLVLGAASFAALWRFGGVPRAGLQLAGAALLLGCAGYAWQGSPSQPGSPAAPPAAAVHPDSDFAGERGRFMSEVGTSAEWLNFADALQRMGETRLAVTAIKSGLKQRPRDAELWIGLGNALVAHSGGLMTPAAELAFDRAGKLAPGHPAIAYFLGLAFAQEGHTERAIGTWRALLSRTPPDAPWRPLVEQRLREIGAASP